MLIEIINLDVLAVNPEDDEKISAINHLMHSHGYRHHIVIASKKMMRDLLASEYLYGLSRTHASEIYESLSEYYSYLTNIKFVLKVDFSYDGDPIYSVSPNNVNVMSVSYKYFSDHTNLCSAKMLAEDMSDYEFYSEIARSSLNGTSLNLPFKLDFRNGGGSQIKKNYLHLKSNDAVCLCIVDTDKKHPMGKEGSTSASFSTSERVFNCSAYAKILDAHEIESFIPESVMEDVIATEANNEARIDSLDTLARLNAIDNRVRLYFDHKNGLSLKTAINLDRTHGDFWLPILANLPNFADKDCLNNKSCTECNACPKIPGYGENILTRSVERLKIMTPQKKAEHVSPQLNEYWSDIKDYVVSWGCHPIGRVSRS
ncbi:hypothetical protein [Aeromonas sp. 102P]|uniref:hypothetical protein n=1 Tax=Aeromonas sp. 102P TaxID=3452711 RepID=UPI003F79E45B